MIKELAKKVNKEPKNCNWNKGRGGESKTKLVRNQCVVVADVVVGVVDGLVVLVLVGVGVKVVVIVVVLSWVLEALYKSVHFLVLEYQQAVQRWQRVVPYSRSVQTQSRCTQVMNKSSYRPVNLFLIKELAKKVKKEPKNCN